MTTLESNVKFAYIARRFAKAKADQLRTLKLPGVGLQEETQRSYLPGISSGSTLAANLLGFVDWNGDGNYGLEANYQKALGGTPGYISSYRDLANREIVLGTHTHQDPVNGSDLVLSLEANVQYAAEQAVADGVHKANTESVSVLLMDPTTDGIVAWADYPRYVANNFMPLPAQDQMSDSQYATTAFGQGIGVNMVQMLSAINVVANGGRYAPPHVVERVGTSINPLLLKPQRQVITATAAQEMTAMMENVVQHGSGWTSRVKGFELDQAGKTGTSQIPVNGQYTLDVWASYVGFLPAQHLKFTMIVVMRKPHYPGSGSDWTLNDGYLTAAPVWQKIAQAIVLDWRITPD